MASRHIPEDIKFEVLLRSNGSCEECGATNGSADFDHWHVPFSVCKKHEAWNIRFICSTCNKSKGKKMEPFGYRQDNLRIHQQAMLAALGSVIDTSAHTGERQAKVIVAGTASGKTRVLLIHAFMKSAFIAASKGFKVKGSLSIIVTPNRATAKRFTEEYELLIGGLDIYGSMLPKTIPVITGASNRAEIGAGLANQPVIVITAPTLFNRLKDDAIKNRINERVGSLIFDEAQYSSAATFSSIVGALPDPELVYATGTVIRHDKEQLPLAPYECQAMPGGKTLQIIQDVAALSGIKEARYTRKTARDNKVIKALSKEPHWVTLEDLFGRAGESHIEGRTLNDFKQEAMDNNTRFDPYTYETVLRCVLGIALDQYKSYCRTPKYRIPGRMLKAIAVAQTTPQADLAARIANEEGWNAVAYYADSNTPKEVGDEDDDSTGLSKVMQQRLADFESDEPGTPNLIIQCNTLSIGYDHPQLFMGIPLRGIASRSFFDQFAGRECRLIKDATGNQLKQEEQPPQCIVALEYGSTAEAVRWYWDEDTELLQIIGPGGDGGGGGGDPMPLALLDGFTSFSKINGEWAEWVKTKETETEVVQNHRQRFGDEAAEELKAALEEAGSATVKLPDDLMVDGRPATFNDFQQTFNEARKKISLHLYAVLKQRGYSDLSVQITVRDQTNPLKTYVWIWANRAINNRYPQLKGPIHTWTGREDCWAAVKSFANGGVELVRGDAEALMTEEME